MTRHRAAVVVAGPDGVGKSSLATALVEEVLAAPVLHLHHRPGVLPRSSAGKQLVTEPHAQPPYPRWLSVLKVVYLWADYQLGWWLRVRPLRRRGGSVVLERGWADIGVDPLRYRLAPTPRLTAVLARTLPAPDLVVVLLADAPAILARKDELSPEEITRQVGLWRRWAERRSNVTVIDATISRPEVIDGVRRALARIAAA